MQQCNRRKKQIYRIIVAQLFKRYGEKKGEKDRLIGVNKDRRIYIEYSKHFVIFSNGRSFIPNIVANYRSHDINFPL